MNDKTIDTLIAMSSDEKYFPLAKGLILSLLDAHALDARMGIAFVDIGCSPASRAWLLEKGVQVIQPDERVMGELAQPRYGYHRSQTCRPFLPELFPGVRTYVWLDCDCWVQARDAINVLRSAAVSNAGKIALCAEIHYSYSRLNDNVAARRAELYSYYVPTYGPGVAAKCQTGPC